MNATKTSQEIKIDQDITKRSEASAVEKDLRTTTEALTLSQRAAIGFPAGVVGAVAVVLLSYVLFQVGSARNSE